MKRVFVLFAACFALAACGGGGTAGGGSITPTAPAPTPALLTPTQQSERADAQQALSGYQAASQITPTGGSSLLSIGRRAPELAAQMHLMRHMHTLTTSACNNGVITTVNQTSSTTATETVSTYYDTSCVTLWEQLTWNVTLSGTTLAGPFSSSQYTKTGTQESYVSGSLSVTLNNALTAITAMSVQMTDIATSPTAPSLGQLGLACGITSSLSCGLAMVANVGTTAEQGASMTLGATETAGSAGSYTVSLTLNTQAYTSAANGMTITPAAFPGWTISGGSLSGSVNGSMTVAYTANGTPTSISASFTDPQYGTTVALSATATGVAGTISRDSTSYGTFSVDVNGNGTIAYSDGTTGQIADWMIVG